MTITRVRFPNLPKWENRGSGHARPGERSYHGLRDLHRKYAGRCGINNLTGADRPCLFLYKENHSLYEWFNEAYGGE